LPHKLIRQQTGFSDSQVAQIRSLGTLPWNAGLPVLDALHNLQPGVTMMIMHCSDAGAHFAHISDSGPLRRGDMLAMLDPAFKKALKDQGIILTTWRELMRRRSQNVH
jgi:hypothetical protein